MSPNAISFLGLVFAAAGTWALYELGRTPLADTTARWGFAIAAAAGIQLRLLMNMLDGLVAVENDRKSATGDLWNEVPDRLADVALLLGAGYGLQATFAPGPLLGWTAAALSLSTAYVRQLGGALGFSQDFCGPMAKQHRMFVLTLGVLASPFDRLAPEGDSAGFVALALAAIVFGAAVTVIRRLLRIAKKLEERNAGSR